MLNPFKKIIEKFKATNYYQTAIMLAKSDLAMREQARLKKELEKNKPNYIG